MTSVQSVQRAANEFIVGRTEISGKIGSAWYAPPRRSASQLAREQEIAAIFVDLRDSTKLANERLPYDALYILDRYVSVVRHAIGRNRGVVTSVAGDGIVAFFGGDGRFGRVRQHSKALYAVADRLTGAVRPVA